MQPRLRQTPPRTGFSSTSRVSMPWSAACNAAGYPPGPPPMTRRRTSRTASDIESSLRKFVCGPTPAGRHCIHRYLRSRWSTISPKEAVDESETTDYEQDDGVEEDAVDEEPEAEPDPSADHEKESTGDVRPDGKAQPGPTRVGGSFSLDLRGNGPRIGRP